MIKADIEEIKKFNRALEQQKKAGAEYRAQYNYNVKELQTICNELTAELGVEVTPQNIKEKREEYMQKVQTTLQNGNEILRRIQAEEQGAQQAQPTQPVQQAQPTQPVQQVQPTQPVQQVQGDSIFDSVTPLNMDNGLIEL